MRRKLFTILAGISMMCIGCPQRTPTTPAVHSLPTTTPLSPPQLAVSEIPVILIYDDHSINNNPNHPPNRLRAAVWSDGRIVWNRNDTLLQSHIDAVKISDLMNKLHRQGVFGEGRSYFSSVAPDSSFMVIEVSLPDRKLHLASPHEAFEQNLNLVATSHGIMALEGRDRDAVLAAQPAEYKRFRQVWSEIRTEVDRWIPQDGEPFEGKVTMDWR